MSENKQNHSKLHSRSFEKTKVKLMLLLGKGFLSTLITAFVF